MGMTIQECLARQASIIKGTKPAAPAPREQAPEHSVSVEECMRRQAAAIAAAAHGGKTNVDSAYIAQLHDRFKEYCKELAKNMAAMDSVDMPAGTKAANGISAGNDEIIVDISADDEPTGMPYQATPVITKKPRKARQSRTKKTGADETRAADSDTAVDTASASSEG